MLSLLAITLSPARFSEIAWVTAAVSVLLGKSRPLLTLCRYPRTFANMQCSFETRDECEDVIKKFHGAPIGEEGMLMQVRYADTPAQKELKRITAERRQFRTNEYNIGAYGTADVGIHPSIYNHQAPWNRRISGGHSSDT